MNSMRLITRCPDCGTMFNVVTDQLKVSQGWVRCGQCTAVFDANLHMQTQAAAYASAEQAVPEQAVPDQVVPEQAVPEQAVPQQSVLDQALPDQSAFKPSVNPPAAFSDPFFEPLARPLLGPMPEPDHAWPAGALSVERRQDPDFDPEALLDVVHPDAFVPPSSLPPVAMLAADRALDLPFNALCDAPPSAALAASSVEADFLANARPEEAHSELSFVRDARRQAFWRRPLVRATLALVCVALAALLLLQWTLLHKDRLAVRYPLAKPWLEQLCKPLGCRVSALRQIEAVVIESSSFSRLGTQAYRLGFSLKNTAALPLAMPFIEVTLTDTQDRAVLRRVISPAQFGAADALLLPGADFAAQLGLVLTIEPEHAADLAAALRPASASAVLSAVPSNGSSAAPPTQPSAPIAGYRLLAFYP